MLAIAVAGGNGAPRFYELSFCWGSLWACSSTAAPGSSLSDAESLLYNHIGYTNRAPLAQLDRASGYEPEGREFESLRARHLPCLVRVIHEK